MARHSRTSGEICEYTTIISSILKDNSRPSNGSYSSYNIDSRDLVYIRNVYI